MDDLLSEGLNLLVFGMGFVFVFLTLLVFATVIMSKLVTKYEPAPVVKPGKARSSSAAPKVAAGAKNDELIAVMSAAIHKFRS